MPDDRISKLSQRFKSHSVGRKPESTRNRERKSFYLDIDLAAQLDTTYKALNHELFPQAVSKSARVQAVRKPHSSSRSLTCQSAFSVTIWSFAHR